MGISFIVLTFVNRQPGKPTKEATSDEEEEDEETAQEKKLRLTKEYLAQLAEEGKNQSQLMTAHSPIACYHIYGWMGFRY